MARYPAFADYEQRGNYADGIKRCDELLKKNPKDVRLLAVKLRLLYVTGNDAAQSVLDDIATLPAQDMQDITAIEDAVIESQGNFFPRPTTTGPSVSKIWETAVKSTSSLNQKLDLASVRFERAVLDNRIVDAQQALIQLKAIQPKNRMVYMAHAAFTQLMSGSNEDLQARLALGLARKAVTEKFDDDKALDCRVPGQIFALQGSEKDLESIGGRPFQESKHVFDARRRKTTKKDSNGEGVPDVPDPKTVNSTEWLSAEISALKQRFSRLGEDVAADTVRAFAANAIRLFKTSLTITGARRSPADACFLAISALVKLSELREDTSYLLQAAFLAESLLIHNEHIHEARLILVYLYMRLGLGSLAMRLFDSLNVKEIQHDTVGHVLFTRLSLTHPHPTSWTKKEGLDPLKRTLHCLKVYDRCEDKLADSQASVLGNGQTGMVFDLHELRDSLRTSLPRRITWLEHRRIARLTKSSVGGYEESVRLMGSKACASWLHTKDNRDFDAAFNYGYNVERALHEQRDGTAPGKEWVLFGLAADTAWCMATEKPALIIDPNDLLHRAQDLESEGKMPRECGMTAAEYLAGHAAVATLKLLNNIREAASEDQIQSCVLETTEACKKLNTDALVTQHDDPLTGRLLDHYAYADVLRIVISACDFTLKKGSANLQEPLKQLQGLSRRSFASLQQHAIEQLARMKPASVRQQISVHEDLAKELQQAGSAESMDDFCEKVAKSAREGWEGLTMLRLV